jgi:hypothetical protein
MSRPAGDMHPATGDMPLATGDMPLATGDMHPATGDMPREAERAYIFAESLPPMKRDKHPALETRPTVCQPCDELPEACGGG